MAKSKQLKRSPRGRPIKATGVLREDIDAKALADAYFLMGLNKVRKQRGEPAMTPQEAKDHYALGLMARVNRKKKPLAGPDRH